MSLVGPSMPVDVHHSGPEAHREPAKKSLEDREILGQDCGIYPRISRALRLIGGVGGTRGRLSESDPSWAANRVARHRTRRGSTWVDHVRSKGHVARAGITWDFRGGGRTTWRGKSRGDGWDRYSCHGTAGRYTWPLLLASPSRRRWCWCAPVAWQGLALICGTCIQKLISKNKTSGWLTLSLSPRNGRLRSGGRSRVSCRTETEQRRQNHKTKLIM